MTLLFWAGRRFDQVLGQYPVSSGLRHHNRSRLAGSLLRPLTLPLSRFSSGPDHRSIDAGSSSRDHGTGRLLVRVGFAGKAMICDPMRDSLTGNCISSVWIMPSNHVWRWVLAVSRHSRFSCEPCMGNGGEGKGGAALFAGNVLGLLAKKLREYFARPERGSPRASVSRERSSQEPQPQNRKCAGW